MSAFEKFLSQLPSFGVIPTAADRRRADRFIANLINLVPKPTLTVVTDGTTKDPRS